MVRAMRHFFLMQTPGSLVKFMTDLDRPTPLPPVTVA